MEHTRCTVQFILITSQKSLRTAPVKSCPEQHPIDFAIRWACKRNRENKGIHYQRKNGYGWRSVSRIELDPFPLHPNNQNLNLIQCNEKGPQTLGTFFPVLNFCFWHPWKHDCHCQFSSKHTNTKQCLALSKVLFNCTLFKMLVNFFTSAYL